MDAATERGGRWDAGRAKAFSDGVFAFAITLLVLDIHVSQAAFDHLWRGIAHQWRSYLGYATSFLTGSSHACGTQVGGIGLEHYIFRVIALVCRRVMAVNLVLLRARSCRSPTTARGRRDPRLVR